MWEALFKILPPPVLAGLLIYSSITFLWLQPLVEGRLAGRTYIPQCEAGTLPEAAARQPEPSPVPQGSLANGSTSFSRDIPMPELPLSVQIVAELKKLFGAEGEYSVPAGVSTGNLCSCSVAVAFNSVFWRSHIHVMSLRTYTPRAIEHFDERVAEVLASGVCGRRG